MGSEYSPDREAQSWFTFSNKADYNGPRALQYYETRLLTNQCRFQTTNHHLHVCLPEFSPWPICMSAATVRNYFESILRKKNSNLQPILFIHITIQIVFMIKHQKKEECYHLLNLLVIWTSDNVSTWCVCALFIVVANFVRLHPQRPPIIMEFRKQKLSPNTLEQHYE